MRKLLFLTLLAVVFPANAAIKFFTDYPNSVPIGSDFFVLQRNNSYINASRDQVKADWFNNPVFGGIIYGNGIGITNVNATGTNANFTFITNFTLYSTNIVVQNITNNNFITTNVTVEFPGGFTNLNLTPKTVMYADINDAESSIPNAIGVLTNDGVGGIGFSATLQLDELDVNRAYLTNYFTGLTNYGVLGTDGNGLLTLGSSSITNITITNAYIQNLTNNTFVNTNTFISTSNSFFNNTTITNANITNLTFISGKGNTLIITNNLNLQYLSASKLVATDGAKNLTNSDVSANLSFSGNVLDIAATPTINLVNSTNLVYRYTTNALTAITMTFGKAYMTNVSANIVITAVNAQDLAALETVCLFATNSGGTDRTITLPNGIGSPGYGLPPVITVTNTKSCWIYVQHYGNQATNCWMIPSY